VLDIEGWTERPFLYQRYGEQERARSNPAPATGRRSRAECATARIALVLRLPNQMIMLVGRDLGEPERFPRRGAPRADDRARHDGPRRAAHLVLRRPPRAEAHRQRLGRQRASWAAT
jgi:hypothetical protein